MKQILYTPPLIGNRRPVGFRVKSGGGLEIVVNQWVVLCSCLSLRSCALPPHL
jgi:hypothetical protein